MKKLLLFIAIVVLAAITVNAQQVLPVAKITKASNVSAPTVTKRHCGTMENLEYLKQQDPTLEARMKAENEKFEKYVAEHQEEILNSKTTYTMPVVVHVVYNGTSGYVAPSRVTEQITQTNSDWAGTNGRSMESFATSLRADCGITLCLATKDPSGNTTTGIDYKTTTKTSFSTNDGVKSTSTGGANAWDVTKYLNIWVCNLGSSLCGYAQFPPVSSTFGVVIHYQFFGLTGASAPYNLGGTTSHEFGHCFNLYHIWGDDGGSCSGTDNCADTPNQADATYGAHSGVLTDACSTSSPGIMYMNFMDYSDDIDYANMTPNQVTRMQACISSYLMSVANNASTACSTGPAAPVAAFTWSPTTPVVNTSVSFTDQSTNTPTTWAWTFGDGGTSTAQSPTHTYTTTGTFNACLTATNAQGSNQTCHNIVVTSTPVAGCDTVTPASFTGNCMDSLVLYYLGAVAPWDSGYATGQNPYHFGEFAQKYPATAGGTISDVIVLYGAKAGTTGNTSIKIYNVSGGNPGTALGTSATIVKSSIDTTNWGLNFNNVYHFTTPVSSAADYFASVVMPATFTAYTDELGIISLNDVCSNGSAYGGYLKYGTTWYSFSSAFGINLDLMILPVVCTTTGTSDPSALENNVIVFPNPAENQFTVQFLGDDQSNVTVNVYNIVGSLVKSFSANQSTNHVQLDMSDVSKGVYIVNIKTDQGTVNRELSIIR